MDIQKKVLVSLAVLVFIIASVWAVSAVISGEGASRDEEDGGEILDTGNDAVTPPGDTDPEVPEAKEHLEGANTEGAVVKKHLANVEVEIKDHVFEPTVLTVSTETTVAWTNESNSRHNVTSTGGSSGPGPGSGQLHNDDTYSFLFEEPGIYEYICKLHPNRMRAVVKVVE